MGSLFLLSVFVGVPVSHKDTQRKYKKYRIQIMIAGINFMHEYVV